MCNQSCPNRATQGYNVISGATVFKTAMKGFGVSTEKDIGQGEFIGEYVGEIVSSAQAKERLESLDESDSCYLLTFKEHTHSGTVLATNIDATFKGNMMRFVNHSCSPNLLMVPVRIDSIVPKVCLFACREIKAGTELCFSYFGQRGAEVAAAGEVMMGKKPCLCGTEECVGYLPLER